MKRIVTVCVVVVCALPVLAEAQQVAQRPSRPYRGLFGGSRPPEPNRTRHELTFTSTVLGGYDDYLTPGSDGGGDPAQPGVSGSTVLADSVLHYWFGKSARHFSADLRTLWTRYGSLDVDPTLGGDLRLNASTELGRGNTLALTQTLAYEPSLVLGAFAPLEGDVDSRLLPDAGVGSGLVDQRSRSSNTSASLERRWSARQTTSASFSYFRRTYLDEFGYDSAMRSVDGRYTRNMNRASTLGASYHFSDSEFQNANGQIVPLREHSIEGETGYTRRLSPSRQIQFSGGVGATFVDTVNALGGESLSYWLPSGHAMMHLDVGRSWAIGADYRRTVNVLQGVTLESFATNSASIRADGVIGRRFEAAISTAFSLGTAAAAEQLGRFEAYSGTAQLRYALARCCAISADYDYYYYNLRDVSQPTGLPTQYDRNAVRIGVSVWLPLFGGFSGGTGEGR
jgi:hypothetical protein